MSEDPSAPSPSPETPQATPPPAGPTSDKKLMAGLFAILLGWAGVHKFVLGYQKEGIIMAVIGVAGFFLCGIPTMVVSIIGIVEGILYLTKTEEEFNRIYVVGRKPWF